MGIDIKSMNPSQAKELWYKMQSGKVELSRAEEASFNAKFGPYIQVWETEADETNYTYRENGEERLDFDEDDAGIGLNKDTAVGAATGGVAVGTFAGTRAAMVSGTEMGNAAFDVLNHTGETQAMCQDTMKGMAKKESFSLLITAAIQLANAIYIQKNSPNKDAVKACEAAQNELYEEQAILAEQIAMMEDMQAEWETLQEQAEARNEEGQGTIGELEGLYHYYYSKYENGTATSQDIAIMNALAAQMQVEQAESTDETVGLNEEIAAIGENYEDISANIETTNEFTDYVSEIDEATKTASIVQGGLMTLACASAAYTSAKCFIRATSLSASLIGAAAAVMYYAAGASSAYAAYIFGQEALKQFKDNRAVAEDTNDIRKETQDFSEETTDFQDISTEMWEETVDTTSIDNLYTTTPTYADETANETDAKGGTRTNDVTGGDGGNTGSRGASGTGTTGQTGGTTPPATGEDKDKDKDKNKK